MLAVHSWDRSQWKPRFDADGERLVDVRLDHVASACMEERDRDKGASLVYRCKVLNRVVTGVRWCMVPDSLERHQRRQTACEFDSRR
jgi:hypothetical protein